MVTWAFIASFVITGASDSARCAAAAEEPRRLRVQIVRGLPEAIAAPAREEVEAIWRPYQIAIEWVTTPIQLTKEPPDLLVSVADRPAGLRSRPERSVIAWILFNDGRPTNYAQVSLQAAIRLLQAKAVWNGLPPKPLQTSMRDILLGRVIGRALAHEIGHYLLGSSQHASSGLMRATIPDDELTDPSRLRLSLPGKEVRALRAARLQASASSSSARCR